MDSGREWAEQCKQDGNKAFKKGDWEGAVGLYLEGVAAVDTMMMHPAEDVKCACYANMAVALMKQEKWKEAIDACDSALKIEERNVKALLRRAQCGIKVGGRATRVEEDIRAVLAVEPNNKDALGLRVELSKKSKERSEASASKQKRVLGSFWSKDGSQKSAIYEDMVSEEAQDKKVDPVCFLEVSVNSVSQGTVYIELFTKKAPKTCENFRCLCTGEKGVDSQGTKLHYEGSLLHRIVKGFIVQGGDVVHREGRSVGEGVASIYGGALRDEYLGGRHMHPGQVCMANSGPNTSGCQFYITLDEAPWLDRDHIVFGQVIQGMEVLQKLEGVEVRDHEDHRPKEDVVITRSGQCSREERQRIKDSVNPRDVWKK
uniref:peptidylprolyl isomerase n=1 Tax=Hemiselmis tepida TaxID=464990 RepID=A0A7S0YPB6_9CRYP|mmetsp:Transcript_169/g.462  ORF Transcript_169/g.462 Transcript_169/m.462 type:complete len:373 (+) Transcript_169:85-1203(+)